MPMVIVMTDKVDDWVAIEYVREVLDDVRKRLRAGSKGPGVTLTQDECVKVLGYLKDPPWPNCRPPKNDLEQISLYIHCLALEDGGMPRNLAVGETAKFFGCSKWKVNDARRKQGTG